MADRWEPTPPIYLQLDVSTLFRGDDLNAEDITEVEMDADDIECDMEDQEGGLCQSGLELSSPSNYTTRENTAPGGRWEDEKISDQEEMPLKRRRIDDLDDSNSDSSGVNIDAGNALSGLMQAYGKRDKSVRWADLQGGRGSQLGFSIGATKEKGSYLIIGPGPGYNEDSNPMDEMEDSPIHNNHGTAQVRKNAKFLEQLRAEQDAFKAVFARRRHQISGVDDDDDDGDD
eukprot:c27409_g3_i3 orf=222-911(-)